MTLNWADLVQNPHELLALYSELPGLDSVTVRSVHLNSYGPALTLRVDLPAFPSNPPEEWLAAGRNRLQLHIQFIAVAHLEMTGWGPHASADIAIADAGACRIAVRIDSSSFVLTFEASDAIVVGHPSVFSAGEDGSDSGPHQFLKRLDARKFEKIPAADEKTFYEHI
ncbi:immunity 50 family protein [Streptomyces sp. NBC_00390]|uniref:Imm50 family immunity protein n=1 Tax=Streptomyces sp. NBC_00390 TaxID=2975736 RepID=UPI002E2048FC